MAKGTDIGYYTLPVIVSMEGLDRQVNSKLSKAFSGISKKTSKQFADDTEADLKRATAAYEKLSNRSADLLGKVRVEEEKLKRARAGGKADQIAAAEERLAKALRDSRAATRAAKAGFDDVTAAQERMATASTKASSGLDSFLTKIRGAGSAAASSGGQAATGFVEGFGGPIAAIGTKAGPVGLALAATAGLGLAAGKILGDQVLAGMDQLQQQAGVAAKLGLTPEQMRPIAKAAAAAYADNFGESTEANLDAARAAIQGGLLDADATGPEVERIVAQLTTVAEVTGETIPAAVRTAQQAVRTGLAKDTTAAFDLIVRAQQRGLNVSEDLFDTINEYGTQFRKLGLDGAQAFGLIAQAVQGGARDTDTAADALKEFSIRSIDGSKSTGQAYADLGLSFKATTEAFAAGGETARMMFQEVVDRIAAVEDPAKKAQIQVALFGTKAEDLGDAINAMNLDTAVAELGEVDGAAQRAADTLGGTGASSIEKAKRSIDVAVDNMQQGLAEAFGPALQKVADWVVANQDKIVGFFTTLGHAAIDAAGFIIRSFGDVASAIGQIIAPLGDVQGAMLKFQAWQADIRGDTETAKQLREQAEEAFGFGEGLTAAGEAMKNFDAENLHKALDGAATMAESAAEETAGLTEKVENLDGKAVEVPVEVAGIDEASQELDDFFARYNEMSINPEMVAPTGVMAGTLLGAGLPAGAGEAGLTPTSVNAKRVIQNTFPAITDVGGWRPPDGYNEHFNGQALDLMIPNWGSAAGKAYGDRVAQYILGNAAALGVDYILWQQRQWNADGTSSPMSDRGSPTQNHMDHIHVHTVGTPQLPGATPPKSSTPTTSTTAPKAAIPPVPVTPPAAMDSAINSSGLPGAIDTSRLYTDAELVNAFGPDYEPGIGTPGTDEYGTPGYYRVDPRALREAQQRADDAAYRITEADAALAEAKAARAALDDTPDVDASTIAGADDDVRRAERAAAIARREAADAATDAADVAKGEFTAAKKAAKEKAEKATGGRGGSDLGGLGGIFGSFLNETLGIGDWLPALDNLMPLQAANSVVGSIVGPLTGMMSEDMGGGTSSAPFGIPDIAAPPMPQNGQHGGGGGAPGPATIVNVDQSQNFSNSQLGWDPVEVNKQRERNINRAPRLPVGMGSS